MLLYDIAIIGGGASGLFAAALLKGKNVAVFERGERLGKKLSATGNGQGNITNLNMSPAHYFTDERARLEKILSAFGAKELLARLTSMGGLFSADDEGRVYPSSRQASSVTDLLMRELTADVYLKSAVAGVKKSGGYSLAVRTLKDGAEEEYFVRAKSVIVCCGGKAQKQFGTDGGFYSVLKELGHSVTPLYPALVQIKTDTEYIKTLRGIRAEAVLSANVKGRPTAKKRGDVIFTEYGISGSAAFFISSYLAGEERAVLSLEFLPDTPVDDIVRAIKVKEGRGVKREELLSCIVNNQLGRSIIKRARGGAEAIAAVLKNFTLEYRGTLGFDYAQVTRGGVPLNEVTDCLESAFNKNLYICGEALNVDGECGGYNLQFAFSSAYSAVCNILKNLK